MQDPRINKLAESLVNYSCKVNKNENVLIKVYGESEEHNLVKALIKEVYKVGGNPFVWNHNPQIMRELLKECNEEQIKLWLMFKFRRTINENRHRIHKL